MATYTVTTSNWNSASFWSGISRGSAGHTLDFSGLGSGYTVRYDTGSGLLTLSNGTTTYTVEDITHSGPSNAALGGNTRFEFFTNVRLPAGSDSYFGSDRAETVSLGGGNDTIFTGGGTDTVTGIDGGDFVNLGAGNESASSSGGNNTVMGGDGNDTLSSAGGDELQGGAGADVLTAAGGNNVLDGGTGADSISAGAGNDKITGGSGQDTISAGAGDDTIFGDGADIGVSAGTLSSFNFTSIGETGNTGNGIIGSYAVYDNIGVTDEGIVVQARVTVLDSEDPNMAFEFNNNSVYLNRDGLADAGTGVTLGFQFFDQATGEPIKITGVFTFMDIDTTAESVTAQTADVTSVTVSSLPATNLNTADNGENLSAASNSSSSGNADQDHWAQFAYTDQQMLIFVVTSRGAGTNYAFSTTGFTGTTTTVTSTPETQHDLIDAGAGNDLVYGMEGNDTIAGGTGKDTIDGGTGTDSIDGGADADVIRVGDGFGADVIRGGEAISTGTDYDVLDFSGMTRGITVTMTGDERGSATDGTDTLSYSEIEGYVLTDRADSFDGQFGPSTSGVTVQGGAGNDSIVGTESADSLDGGADNDTLRGGIGKDTITGGSGDDSIHGNEGDDSLSGGDGADTIYGEEGDDYVEGGAGDDHLEGNEGDDTLIGGAGNDWMRGSFGNDALHGGTGDDYLWGGYGDDTFHIENGFGNDTVDAEAEDETLGDVLDLSAVTDALRIDLSGNNPEIGTVSDGTGTLEFSDIETIVLGSGTDTVVLADGSGADTVTGFAAPTDTGGGTYAGRDRIDVSGLTDALGNPVNVDDVTVTDTLGDGSGDAVLTFPNGETLTLVGVRAAQVSSPEQLIAMGIPPVPPDYVVSGTGGADLINDAYTGDPEGDRIDANDNATGTNDDLVLAGDGDDTIDAGAGDDTVHGDSGDDEIFIDASLDNDSIIGGETGETQGDRINLSSIADDLTITFTGAETGTIGDGTHTTRFAEIERFQLGTGNDSVTGSDGAEHIIGNYGDDTILAGGGDDTIFSGFDNDSVSGGAGNDSLVAGSGADTVEGGAGDDTIDLGAGDGNADVLVLADGSGRDVVSGFETPTALGGGAYGGRDRLDVSGLRDLGGNPVTTEDVTVTDTNGDGTGHAILTFPNGEQITLVGVTVAEVQSPAQLNAMGIPLSPGDFIVEGTSAGDLIDTAYAGDPNGDFVDNADGIGGSQDDTILAYGGNDTVRAGAGDDSVEGGAGDDVLDGGAGDDTLRGGDGNDRLVGSGGNNLLDGGAGADLFEVGHGTDTVIGGETGTDEDTLSIAAADDAIDIRFTGDEAGTYTDDDGDSGSFSEIEAFELSAGNDAVDARADGSGIRVMAGAGDDTLTGGTGDDSLMGEAGNDSLAGGLGADSLDGGEGDDVLHVGSGDTAWGGGGDDSFLASAADMNGDNLTITGGESGETGGDTLTITGPAKIAMTGAESGTVTWLDGSTLTFSEIENVNYIPCFTPGTLIKSVRGELDAAEIRRGDRVLTRDNGYKRVLWAGSRILSAEDLAANPALCPVLIRQGALGRNIPERDMVVSPQHRVVMGGAAVELLFGEDEVLVSAGHLVGRKGITRLSPSEGVTYVHFMFESHELVLSDGAWTESFQPGDLSLRGLDAAQRDELLTLFPELASAPGRGAYTAARVSLKAEQARLLAAA